MTVRISIANQKGGAGKTTTTIHLGGALNHLGYDVLLVDGDYQGTLTEGVGLTEEFQRDGINFNDVITGAVPRDRVNEIIRESPDTEFDVIPAHVDMVNYGARLQDDEFRDLDNTLTAIEKNYDFILIDSRPSLNEATHNALVAAGNVLIPSQAKRSFVRAFELLADQIEYIEQHFTNIDRLGVVVNEVEKPINNDQREMIEWYNNYFRSTGVFVVRAGPAITRAFNNGKSIFTHEDPAKQEDLRETYLELARHVKRLTVPTGVEA